MVKFLIPTLGFALALSAPAFAQSNSAQGSHANTGAAAVSGTKGAVSPDKLKKTLSDAGFQNVHILDQSFLVQAQTKDGDTVLMMLNPPGPTTASSTGTSGGASSSGSSSPPSGSAGSGSTSSGGAHK